MDQKELEKQAERDRQQAIERNKPVEDLLKTFFPRQFVSGSTKEKQK